MADAWLIGAVITTGALLLGATVIHKSGSIKRKAKKIYGDVTGRTATEAVVAELEEAARYAEVARQDAEDEAAEAAEDVEAFVTSQGEVFENGNDGGHGKGRRSRKGKGKNISKKNKFSSKRRHKNRF
jgi:hypothetical protein